MSRRISTPVLADARNQLLDALIKAQEATTAAARAVERTRPHWGAYRVAGGPPLSRALNHYHQLMRNLEQGADLLRREYFAVLRAPQ